MGKYSLESFEKYKVLRMRPQEREAAAHTPDSRTFTTVRVTLGGEIPTLAGPSLLVISVPEESTAHMARTESAIQALASGFYRDARVLGVTLESGTSEAKRRRLWEITALAFAPKRYYVPVNDGAQIDTMLRRGLMGGLYVPVGPNVYDTCMAFAENGAQQLYRRMPVLVSFGSPSNALPGYAEGWHAQAVENAQANAGWCIALRRLMTPRAITSGGFAPLRFWWTNRGPAYCHERTRVCVRLTNGEIRAALELHDEQRCIHLADRTHNEIVRVPQIAAGRYRLEFAVMTAQGEALRLAHEGRTEDGFYCAGEIAVDDVPRPELEHIWDDYSPDGYYPLEDPKVPG